MTSERTFAFSQMYFQKTDGFCLTLSTSLSSKVDFALLTAAVALFLFMV